MRPNSHHLSDQWRRVRDRAQLGPVLAMLAVLAVFGCRRDDSPARDAQPTAIAPRRPVLHELWRWNGPASIAGPVTWAGAGWCAAFTDGSLVLLDPRGQLSWRTSSSNGWATAPVVAGDVCAVLDAAGTAVGHDRADGRVRWRQSLGSGFRQPPVVVPDGTNDSLLVFLSASDGVLVALDSRAGRPRWRSRPTNRCDGPAAADGAWLAYGNCDAAVHGFATTNGAYQGATPVGAESQMAGALVLTGGAAFGGTRDGGLVRVDLAATSLVWRTTVSASEFFLRPELALARGWVLAGTAEGEVLALGASDGAVIWRATVAAEPITGLAVDDGCVWVLAGATLRLLDAGGGALLGTRDYGVELCGPVLGSQQVAVATSEGLVVALAAASDRTRPGKRGVAPPAEAGP